MATRSAKAGVGVNIDTEITLTPTASEGGQVAGANPKFNYGITIPDGTGANQVRFVWKKNYTGIGSGAPQTIDLTDLNGIDIGQGVGNDAVAQVWGTTDILGVIIKNTSSNTATQITADSVTDPVFFAAIGDGVDIEAGGVFGFVSARTAMNVNTGASIRITNNDTGNNADFEVLILAR